MLVKLKLKSNHELLLKITTSRIEQLRGKNPDNFYSLVHLCFKTIDFKNKYLCVKSKSLNLHQMIKKRHQKLTQSDCAFQCYHEWQK